MTYMYNTAITHFHNLESVMIIEQYHNCCSHLLTCGSDGDVRIYKGFEDSDPDSIRAGEQVTAISVKVST